jgi:hypothetical protein
MAARQVEQVMAAEAEGIIKFELQFERTSLLPGPELEELCTWRDRFYGLGIIGQDPRRYNGDAFGNISQRVGHGNSFLISGSQTGGQERALPEHFTCVDDFDLSSNCVVAHGPVRPSSESLTHGAIYALSPEIRCVVHGHSPQLWSSSVEIGLPGTAREVAYGTPEMARAIALLYQESGAPDRALFSMLGHKDGIVAFARNFAAIEDLIRSNVAIASRASAL